jgi:hypothetical protein
MRYDEIIKNILRISIILTFALCVTSCGERWPKSDELADAVMGIINEVNAKRAANGLPVSPATHAQFKAKFESCNRKWKKANKSSGITEYNYQFGDQVLTFYWFDYGKSGGKTLVPKLIQDNQGLFR